MITFNGTNVQKTRHDCFHCSSACLSLKGRRGEKKETEKEMLAQRQMLCGMVVTTLVVLG